MNLSEIKKYKEVIRDYKAIERICLDKGMEDGVMGNSNIDFIYEEGSKRNGIFYKKSDNCLVIFCSRFKKNVPLENFKTLFVSDYKVIETVRCFNIIKGIAKVRGKKKVFTISKLFDDYFLSAIGNIKVTDYNLKLLFHSHRKDEPRIFSYNSVDLNISEMFMTNKDFELHLRKMEIFVNGVVSLRGGVKCLSQAYHHFERSENNILFNPREDLREAERVLDKIQKLLKI